MSAPVCCAPVAAGPMSDAAALEVALRLKALADPARVKIMSLLFCSVDAEKNSGDLAAALGASASSSSSSTLVVVGGGLKGSGASKRGGSSCGNSVTKFCLDRSPSTVCVVRGVGV